MLQNIFSVFEKGKDWGNYILTKVDGWMSLIRYDSKSRVEWIDCAKGITILFVIIGHTIGGFFRGAIFSFHMPLFFILSCVTFKYSESKEQFVTKTERAFRHLIFPATIMYCLESVIFVVKNYELFISIEYIIEFLRERILTAIYSSGVDVWILNSQVTAVGIPWFLVVLFLGRTLFDYLHLKLDKRSLAIWCCILSVIGVALGKIQWLPFSFDIVLAVMPLFYAGILLKEFNVTTRPTYKFWAYGGLWGGTLLFSHLVTGNYMELACRRYTLYPLCFIIAISGTLMIIEFCIIITRLKKLIRPILYLGKNSLYMLCIHILDSSLFDFWRISENEYINSICRVLFDCIIFVIVMSFVEKLRKSKCI